MHNDEENGDNPLQQFREMFSAMVQQTPEAASAEIAVNVAQVSGPLEKLCEQLVSVAPELAAVSDSLDDFFDARDHVLDTLCSASPSLSFFPSVYRETSKAIRHFVNGYLTITGSWETYVRGKLPELSTFKKRKRNDDKLLGEQELALRKARDVLDASIQLYVDSCNALPQIAKDVRKMLNKYDAYLQERFVRQGKENEHRVFMVSLMQQLPQEFRPFRGDYVKIKLVDENPVLTDILLSVADSLPQPRDRIVTTTGKRAKALPFVSNYALEESATLLSAMSDRQLFSYISEPKRFFSKLGELFEKINKVAEKVAPHARIILGSPGCRVRTSNEEVRRALRGSAQSSRRDIQAIKQMDLDRIVQNKDEVLPSNRRESDYFAARDKLFTHIRQGLSTLKQIDNISERESAAKEQARVAVDLKAGMTKANMSGVLARLRRNKIDDNEFYVGRQERHGEFCFERQPAPETRLDDVIGASFNDAKQHLNEIIETGEFSRAMQLSAPGGKVKSNICLIGPYGCGKTELARAVCGDKRVIGASVSVANTLTAYMHESVNNIKRIYDKAMELRREARDMKPVVLVLDEFDGWFATSGDGRWADVDMKQIQNVFLEVLDGMEDYTGIITLAMTNKPKVVPAGILRRFRHVDVVGQLTMLEREQLLKMYLEKRLPVAPDVPAHYAIWAKQLEDAPGDVVRKVADEVHFQLVPPFLRGQKKEARRIEKVLLGREMREGSLGERDIAYVRTRLYNAEIIATPAHVERALTKTLNEPQIKQQISAAKQVYAEAPKILEELSKYKQQVI